MKRIALLLALLTVVAGPARAQFNGITAELQLIQDQYLPDEDLQLKVKITNRSGQTVSFGQDNQWITFNIVGENSFIVPKISEMPVSGHFTLPSGQSGALPLNLTPYFDFRRPGHYRIGATIKISQWNQEIPCKPVSFTVANGLPLHGRVNLQFGVPPPPGVSNAVPEVRNYSLLKVAYLNDLTLYFRLTDSNGRTLKVFPLSGMLSFSEPEAQLDRFNNLHVLVQTGARSFTYSVITPEGRLIARQRHEYSSTRPVLRATDDGTIYVGGGLRRLSESDIPPPTAESARSQ
ncbi:MAG TPA: hypothetical protein VMR33_02635 [Candidatus Baltobacteraceae bacterium]|jgi:hypothetical protein|nr:hypothetical protein [Candidatus Baltobacteraceae bacterium]